MIFDEEGNLADAERVADDWDMDPEEIEEERRDRATRKGEGK